MLINGQWAEDFQPVHDTDEEGGFLREDAGIRHWITVDGRPGPSGEGGFVAEPGRYHLYVALICPWASRTLMVRALKGLQDAVSVTVLDPRLTDKVWRFGGDADALPGSQADPHYVAEFLYELYLRARPDYTGQITVPVLWDKQRETIVSNESSEIIRMLNGAFGAVAANDGFLGDLPEELMAEPNIPPGHPEAFHDAFARLHRCFEVDVRAYQEGKPFDCDGSRYANVADGRMGIAYIDAAVKSSQQGGGWVGV